jgi:molybdate transport system substrate-binding protein
MMRRRFNRSGSRRFVALLGVVVALCLAAPAAAGAVTVYAAASLREALPEMAPAQTYNFAGSNALQLQIERGAPADVFASAAPEEAQALFRAGLCSRPVTFATNVVVMLVPKGNPGHLKSVYSLRQGSHTVAIGAPGVPIGGYTRELLARMRLSSILTSNTVTLEKDVAGITSKVALGAVEAGFAYVTDGRIVAGRVEIIRLPRWAQPPVRYQACIVHRPGVDAAGAKKFIEALTGPRGRKALKKGGFGLPPSA